MPAAGSTHIQAFVGRRLIGSPCILRARRRCHGRRPDVRSTTPELCDADQYRSLAHLDRLIRAGADRLRHDTDAETQRPGIASNLRRIARDGELSLRWRWSGPTRLCGPTGRPAGDSVCRSNILSTEHFVDHICRSSICRSNKCVSRVPTRAGTRPGAAMSVTRPRRHARSGRLASPPPRSAASAGPPEADPDEAGRDVEERSSVVVVVIGAPVGCG